MTPDFQKSIHRDDFECHGLAPASDQFPGRELDRLVLAVPEHPGAETLLEMPASQTSSPQVAGPEDGGGAEMDPGLGADRHRPPVAFRLGATLTGGP